MIIPFVFTLDTVADGRQLTWVFNKAVSFSKEYGWPVIAQKQYYDYYLEDASASGAEYFDYDVPQPVFLKKITSVVIPEKLEKNFIKKFPSQIDAYLHSVRYKWTDMTEFLVETIHQLEIKYGEKVEAVMSIRYYKFLNDACEKCGISVLYYEWGPFRTPNYRNTAHLDFCGLQGNSSIEENYSIFKKELEDQEVPMLDSKGILSLFLNNDKLNYLWKQEEIPEYEVGIMAGYTTPGVSNSYNAMTLDEMVYQCRKVFQPNKIGIRLHPGDPLRTQPAYGNVDSCGLLDFILKSKRIVCNGSNIAYEAALYNRPAYDLGWSQFSFMVNTTLERLEDKIPDKQALNFVAFSALIPYELLNNVEYLRFRLKKPKLTEIYRFHFQYYLESYGADISLVKEKDFAKQLCELRLRENNISDISSEFQKYYSFSLENLKYMKLKNKLLSLQLEKQTVDELAEKQGRQIADLQYQANEKEKQITDLQCLLESAKEKIQTVEKEKEAAEENLRIMMDSNVYKATKPLRAALDIIKKVF